MTLIAGLLLLSCLTWYSRSPIIRNSINRKVRSTGFNLKKNHTWSSTVLSIFLCLFFPYNLFLFFHPLMDHRRKRVSLTIFQKVEILKKLQHGSSVKMIQEEYNVWKSKIYDLRSDKEKILQYAAECESANLMKNRKTMKPA